MRVTLNGLGKLQDVIKESVQIKSINLKNNSNKMRSGSCTGAEHVVQEATQMIGRDSIRSKDDCNGCLWDFAVECPGYTELESRSNGNDRKTLIGHFVHSAE